MRNKNSLKNLSNGSIFQSHIKKGTFKKLPIWKLPMEQLKKSF